METLSPFFSIIIPTYNRPTQLASCLESLCRLNYPSKKFEVVVVNDGGLKPLDDLITPYKTKINLLTINQANAGPASARNSGAKMAKGHFLAFTDDDCTPDSNWLISLEKRLMDHPNCIVGGTTVNILYDNVYSTASQSICDLAYDYYNTNHDQARFFSSNNIALARRNFLGIGGFDEDFKTAEDRELCKRWLNNGLEMIFVPEAIVYHAHELTLKGFIKQHFSYGRGSYQFYNKKSLHGPGYFRGLIKFNLNPKNIFIYPLSKNKGSRGFSIALLLMLWQITNVSGFLHELLNHKIGSRSKLAKDLRNV